jgi:hypothetical protein
VWDRPVFEAFFRDVRAVNASLPKDRQIRVLLGDPPIDWSKINSADDYGEACRSVADRDSCPAAIIQREVLVRQRRALVVYGAMHFLRRNPYWQMKDQKEAEQRFNTPANSIVSLLESQGVKVYSVWSTVLIDLAALHSEATSWKVPSLVPIHDTPLGVMSFRSYYPHIAFTTHDGVAEEISIDPIRSPVMQEQFDAVLYYGRPSELTWSRVPLALASDPEYVKMRLDRIGWAGLPIMNDASNKHTQVPIAVEVLDRYVGTYKASETTVLKFRREGDHLMSQRTGQGWIGKYPMSDTTFFAKVVEATDTFVVDDSGHVTALIHYQNGRESTYPRIDAAEGGRLEAILAAKVKSQTATPGTEDALRRNIEGLQSGNPIYSEMSPDLQEVTRKQLPELKESLNRLGPVKSVQFVGVGNQGWDIYQATHDSRSSTWLIHLAENGIIDGVLVQLGP